MTVTTRAHGCKNPHHLATPMLELVDAITMTIAVGPVLGRLREDASKGVTLTSECVSKGVRVEDPRDHAPHEKILRNDESIPRTRRRKPTPMGNSSSTPKAIAKLAGDCGKNPPMLTSLFNLGKASRRNEQRHHPSQQVESPLGRASRSPMRLMLGEANMMMTIMLTRDQSTSTTTVSTHITLIPAAQPQALLSKSQLHHLHRNVGVLASGQTTQILPHIGLVVFVVVSAPGLHQHTEPLYRILLVVLAMYRSHRATKLCMCSGVIWSTWIGACMPS